MNKKIIVSTGKEDKVYLFKRMQLSNICFENFSVSDDKISVTIYKNDFDKLKKYDYKNSIIYEKNVGVHYFISALYHNLEKLLLSFLIIFILFFSNNVIYKINIITSDNNLEKILRYELEDYKVKPYALKKRFTELRKIKTKVKNKHKDDIEWLEIKTDGNIYNVYIIPRKKDSLKSDNAKCNYVANKSGTIKKIKVTKGVLVVQENNYVNKGDVLITGSVIYNEELKNEVCARGTITGEVWYKVNVSVPLYERKKKIKKSKYNVAINLFNNEYLIFKSKYNNRKSITSVGNNDLKISIIKNIDINTEYQKISNKKAENKAIRFAREKILKKNHNNSRIISENILKKETNNDKINIEVLVTTEEELGVVENYL